MTSNNRMASNDGKRISKTISKKEGNSVDLHRQNPEKTRKCLGSCIIL